MVNRMRESLRLLKVESSGLYDIPKFEGKTDEEVVSSAEKISDLKERIAFLREYAKAGHFKSKRYLASLLKKDDPEGAWYFLSSICPYVPLNPENYYLLAELALEHKAITVAKSLSELVMWLCFANKEINNDDSKAEIVEKNKKLLTEITEKISKGEKDEDQGFWKNKLVDKFWVLERLCLTKTEIKKIIAYATKLLDTFPLDSSSYWAVYRAYLVCRNKEAFKSFLSYIKEKSRLDNQDKNLYVGLAELELNNFDAAQNCFLTSLKINPQNVRANLFLAVSYLLREKITDFTKTLKKIILPPNADLHTLSLYGALYFISSAFLNYKPEEVEFPNQKNISQETLRIIDKLYELNKTQSAEYLVMQFEKLDFQIRLPYLFLYLAESFIRNKKLEMARKFLAKSTDYEAHRLYSWIYRLEGKDDLAEEELLKYRKNWVPDKDVGLSYELVSLDLPEKIPDKLNDIMNLLTSAYKQTKEQIKELDLEYGTLSMTCVETGCQDCCKKTFPYVSYTEYLYMKEWFDKQPSDFKKMIHEASRKIVDKFIAMNGKEPPFITSEGNDPVIEYPLGFDFDCPFLGDNKCNVYEARPYTCRAYGFGSQGGVRVKACNYFSEQLRAATKLNKTRKVLNMQAFYDFTAKVDEKLIGKKISAPIPVWFAQSHEETLEKVKKYL